MKNKHLLILIVTLLLILLGGCSQSTEKDGNLEEDTQNEQIQIYTTLFPLQDFTEKIGGKYVQVENIVPAGSDAHTFEPTTKTMIKIAEGDAFIYLGTGIEGFTDSVIDAVRNEETKIIKASEGISLINSTETSEEESHDGEEEKSEEADGDIDPHVWLDPVRAIKLAESIKNSLVEINPNQRKYFEENYNNLKENLEKLDSTFRAMVKGSSNNSFIVSHSAYGYWEDAYGLNQIGISGLSPSDEPSQKSLQEIVENAESSQINYVLFEQNVENRVAEIIKREIGADTLTIHNLESLSEEDIKNNEDYLSIMEKNIETLRMVLK